MKSPKSQYHISECFLKGHVQRWGLWMRSRRRDAACCSCLGYQSQTAHCSLIAAAVTGACITHLSALHSSAHLLFRRKSTPRSRHAYIYMLTGRPYKTSEAHRHTQARVTHPGWAGFHLCGAALALTEGSAGVSCLVTCLVTVTVGRFFPVIRTECRSVVPKLWGARRGTLQQGGRVNQGGLTGSEPVNHSFAPTQPVGQFPTLIPFSLYTYPFSLRLPFALIMGLASVTPIWNLALTQQDESQLPGYFHKGWVAA